VKPYLTCKLSLECLNISTTHCFRERSNAATTTLQGKTRGY